MQAGVVCYSLGDNSCFADDFPCSVVYEEMEYPNAYAAMQASKNANPDYKEAIANGESISKAKLHVTGKRGVWMKEDETYLANKHTIHEVILRDKFTRNKECALALLRTGGRPLVQTGNMSDPVWSYCRRRRVGENKHGTILMKLRRELWSLYYPNENS